MMTPTFEYIIGGFFNLQWNAFLGIDLSCQAKKTIYAFDDVEVVFSDRRGAIKS